MSVVFLLLAVGVFLSTLSLRRATTTSHDQATKAHRISIHALLAESDRHKTAELIINVYFYPRSPCGERPIRLTRKPGNALFLSTLSLRRATNSSYAALDGASISIHALLAESDERANSFPNAPPQISIHALLAESDYQDKFATLPAQKISIHALLAESDSKSAQNSGALLRI